MGQSSEIPAHVESSTPNLDETVKKAAAYDALLERLEQLEDSRDFDGDNAARSGYAVALRDVVAFLLCSA